MTCRDDILRVVRGLIADRPERDFRVFEVVDRMRLGGSRYPTDTIRRNIMAVMCVNGPASVPCRYDDLERIGPGLYRLR